MTQSELLNGPETQGIARSLISIALIGTWHAKATADGEVVETLSGRSYQEIEESITDLRELR